MTSNFKPLKIDDEGFLQNIKFVASPNFDKRPNDSKITMLVIHSISLPPDEYGGQYIEQFFTNTLDTKKNPYFKKIKDLKVSSHFVIDRKGIIIQFVSCNQRAWHAGTSIWKGRKNCNDFSIGIELEGSDHVEYSRVQYEKLIQLIDCLKAKYDIQDIVGHCDVSPGRKTDPGHIFDWNKIK